MKRHKEDETRKVPIEAGENAEQERSTQEEEVSADMEALQTEIEKLQASAREAHDQYVRTLADFDNFRKRQREETARACDFARVEVISALLPIIDNFERSVQAAEEQHSYDALVEGVSLTLRGFHDMLAGQGVEAIESVGQEFNPELHEALMRVDTGEYPDNTVVDELEKGYTLNGKVLRPARVRVAMSD
ncbi:MAG: nucleotide exchange factor GrpE [Armatimonadota bacterium]|nr:nucleotide exchange factor GrpE [bacterium]